jgi:hypothetical protein
VQHFGGALNLNVLWLAISRPAKTTDVGVAARLSFAKPEWLATD